MESKQAIATALLSATILVGGCSSDQKKETAAHTAEAGDVLVISENTQVVLKKPFKPGTPNGLYDGGVTEISDSGQELHFEVNAVCSMPDLPGWPQYDNIFGKQIDTPTDAGETGGQTKWQTLLHFDGSVTDQGPEPSPEWAERLAENLCRKGDFTDTSNEVNKKNRELTLEGKSIDVDLKSTNP